MTWQELEEEIDLLVKKIDVLPDIIVGIARGGLIPARLLATRLNTKDMFVLTINKKTKQVETKILKDLTGKTILLVEDMLESGGSLEAGREYLEKKGALVKTACLYTLPITQTQPTYSLRQLPEALPFPWE